MEDSYEKKRIKQLAGLCLLLSAAFGLCACGGSATESGKENNALAKEYVYRFQEIAMPDFGGDEYEVCASDYRDGKIFLLMKVIDWERPSFFNRLSLKPFHTKAWGVTESVLRQSYSAANRSILLPDVLPPELGSVNFNLLNDICLILISPFDLFGKGLYRYTFIKIHHIINTMY